ncbi:MAG: hypothetical protein IPK19_10035 [Chloroflexi bacterium]|nr:hypothetical protein [Chloroflexota bacterium]
MASANRIVVLHGAFMSIPAMGDLIPRLAETRKVFAFELEGQCPHRRP